jgi:GntR family transcriptional regulator/MocR family aminotransferase
MGETSRRGQGRALYEEIKARVLDGTYGAGTLLPSTRACAAERGLSRTTVSTVYEQLAAEGFIETKAGASSRVAAGAMSARGARAGAGRGSSGHRDSLPQARLSAFGQRVRNLKLASTEVPAAGHIDFKYGPLAGADFPTLAWMKASRKVERERPPRLAYTDPRGDPGLRRALQAYLARARGISCQLDQLLIVNGSQQALDLCARVLLDPGDLVVVENPGYRMAHHVFSAVGARLLGIPVDQQGLMTDELARVRHAALAFVTPTHQFPLGAFLAMPRRQALLKWAAQTGAWILEDDYDSEYRYAVRPEPTLQSLDARGAVIYIGTFSKTLSPELRLGYMIVPPQLAGTFASAKQLADRHAASHAQRTLAPAGGPAQRAAVSAGAAPARARERRRRLQRASSGGLDRRRIGRARGRPGGRGGKGTRARVPRGAAVPPAAWCGDAQANGWPAAGIRAAGSGSDRARGQAPRGGHPHGSIASEIRPAGPRGTPCPPPAPRAPPLPPFRGAPRA